MLNQLDSTIEEIKLLLSKLGQSDLTPSAYDTAWGAKIKSPNDSTQPLYPSLLNWLVNNQLPDGSWGSKSPLYYHDRIISTLSAIAALKFWDIYEDKVLKGINYIEKNIINLTRDHHDTIGFEMVFPSLVEEVRSYGVNLEIDENIYRKYEELLKIKLSRIPLEWLYEKKTTISYSLESLSSKYLDFEKLKIHKEVNGSYGASPASSAFVLNKVYDQDVDNYLQTIISKFENFLPTVFPVELFEISWTLSYIIDLKLEKFFPNEINRLLDILNNNWTEIGVAWTKYITYPDLDDTVVTLRVLNHFGFNKSLDVLEKFRINNTFMGFEGQREGNPSYLVNLIRLIESTPNYIHKQKYLEQAYTLLDQFKDLAFLDKWHVSQYYTFSKMLFEKDSYKKLITDKIIKNQNANGGWGYSNNSNLEETSYALIYLLKNYDSSDIFIPLNKGFEFILNNINKEAEPLWIGKCLYAPKTYVSILPLLVLLYCLENQLLIK